MVIDYTGIAKASKNSSLLISLISLFPLPNSIILIFLFMQIFLFTVCGSPPILENGLFISQDNIYTRGSKVFYQCNANYKSVGQNTRTCLKNGTWTKTDLQCVAGTLFKINNSYPTLKSNHMVCFLAMCF